MAYDSALEDSIVVRDWSKIARLPKTKSRIGESDDFNEIWRYVAQLHDDKETIRFRARQNFQALLERTNPVQDESALRLLDRVSQTYRGNEALRRHISNGWVRAVAAVVKNERILQTWFFTTCTQGRYREAKQAAMVWMKAFPDHHHAFYLFILANHLVSQQADASESESRLCQLLAYKALTTAIKDSKFDSTHIPQGRTIATCADIEFAVKTLASQGKHVEGSAVLKLLRTSNCSGALRWTWDLLLLEIACLKSACCWNDLLALCQQILRDACQSNAEDDSEPYLKRQGDDWQVWDAAIQAAENLRSGSDLEHLLQKFSRSRNTCQAALRLTSASQERLLAALENGFDSKCTRAICLQDLREFSQRLTKTHQRKFIEYLCHKTDGQTTCLSEESVMIEANALRLEYVVLVGRSKDRALSMSFVDLCMSLFRASVSLSSDKAGDRGPGEDAALLAANVLLQLYVDGAPEALLRSVAILEELLSVSPQNFDALIILVRLYLHMGAGALAVHQYVKLQIKNIQQASVSWLIFDQLATIHPWPVCWNGTMWDSLEELNIALDWHENSPFLNAKAFQQALVAGRWSTAIDLLDLQRRITSGSTLSMLRIQTSKTQRLRAVVDHSDFDMMTDTHVSYDNRDISPFKMCIVAGDSVLNLVTCPCNAVQSHLDAVYEALWRKMTARSDSVVAFGDPVGNVLDRLIHWILFSVQLAVDALQASSITRSEMCIEKLCDLLNKILTATEKDDALWAGCVSPGILSAAYLRARYRILECLILLARYRTLAKESETCAKPIEPRLQTIMALARKIQEQISHGAYQVQQALTRGNNEKIMADLRISDQENAYSSIHRSWIDAVEGLQLSSKVCDHHLRA